MSLRNLLQRIHIVNLDFELARLEQREELIGVEFVLLASVNVSEQLGTRDLEVLGREFPKSVALASWSPSRERKETH